MKRSPRQALIKLGAEALADTLLQLATHSSDAASAVSRLTSKTSSGGDADAAHLRAALAEIADIDYDDERDWDQECAIANDLEAWLDEVSDKIEDPRVGVELLTDFFQIDRIIEMADDEFGSAASVFESQANELFVSYAAECVDKDWLADQVATLFTTDDFGVRLGIVTSAHRYLPEPLIRHLADAFLDRAATSLPMKYGASHWRKGVSALARQLKDAGLFERSCLANDPAMGEQTCLSIGEVYLDCGDPATAISWLERAPSESQATWFTPSSKRDPLLLRAYQALDLTDKAAEVAWRMFRKSRSADSLDTLLGVIGEEKRREVIDAELLEIFSIDAISYGDVHYLTAVGMVDAAEAYIIARASLISGDDYFSILPIAQKFEAEERPLAATLLYRALIDSILQRGKAQAYHYGAAYLERLIVLAPLITDWGEFVRHKDYLAGIRQAHGRKKSFWSRCVQLSL